jgi:hypothetical protein
VLNEGDFLGWCRRLALAETTQSAIAEVRSRNPTRRVGGGRDNVSGRYPSCRLVKSLIVASDFRSEGVIASEIHCVLAELDGILRTNNDGHP